MQRNSLLGLVLCLASLLLLSSAAAGQAKSVATSSHDVANAAKVVYPGTPGLASPPKKASSASSEGPDSSQPWEIEFHGGGAFATNPDGGSKALPAAGASFTNAAGTSRAISSYMFGDGAALFNTRIAAGGAVGTTQIVPLDNVLTSRAADRTGSGSIGFRISRDFTPRWGLEFSTDYSFAPNEITSRTLAGVEATRASWVAAHSDNFTNGCGCPNTVSAISDTRHRSEGSQVFLTGAVNFNLITQKKFIPYVTIGGGAVINAGANPHAGIFGQYTLLGAYAGTDQVGVRPVMEDVQGTFLFGIGAKYYVSHRWGLRFDFRDHLTPNDAYSTRLDASPFLPNIPGSGPVGPGGNPTVIFSNDPTLGQDTLSGPTLTKFRAFRGDGVQNLFNGSVGIFFRF